MTLKYFTIERTDRNLQDVLRKLRRELGTMRLHSFIPIVSLGGNTKIIELRQNYGRDGLIVKIDGPEFLIKEIQEYFSKGGMI